MQTIRRGYHQRALAPQPRNDRAAVGGGARVASAANPGVGDVMLVALAGLGVWFIGGQMKWWKGP